MAPHVPPHPRSLNVRRAAGAAVLAACLAAAPLSADDEKPAAKPPGKAGPDPAAVEVRFTDSSTMKMSLREERIEVVTRYGKLLVPVADIRRIDFATRIPDDVVQKIEAAVANLGSPQYKLREAAQADLLALREKAYPALVRATKHKDPEVIRRAEDLLNQIRQAVPEDQLESREFDVVQTDDMRVTGRISEATFKVFTSQFGEQPLKLADVRHLRSQSLAAEEVEPKNINAIADPGNLSQYQNQFGKVLYIRVTGGGVNVARGMPGGGMPGGAFVLGPGAGGAVWGTDVYTTDSTLAMAAVHAGAVQMGQTAVVKVTIVPPPPNFQGSTRNGVTTMPYDQYPAAYTIAKVGGPRGR
jgi:LCCL domain